MNNNNFYLLYVLRTQPLDTLAFRVVSGSLFILYDGERIGVDCYLVVRIVGELCMHIVLGPNPVARLNHHLVPIMAISTLLTCTQISWLMSK